MTHRPIQALMCPIPIYQGGKSVETYYKIAKINKWYKHIINAQNEAYEKSNPFLFTACIHPHRLLTFRTLNIHTWSCWVRGYQNSERKSWVWHWCQRQERRKDMLTHGGVVGIYRTSQVTHRRWRGARLSGWQRSLFYPLYAAMAEGSSLWCHPLLAFRPLNLSLDTLVDHAAPFDWGIRFFYVV